MLQFDVCCKAIDQTFNCGCDRCAILGLDSLIIMRHDFAVTLSWHDRTVGAIREPPWERDYTSSSLSRLLVFNCKVLN